MFTFRSTIGALLLLSGTVWGQGDQSPLVCSTGSGAVTPLIRTEGLTELTGDVLITCTGGVPQSAGSALLRTNIVVSVNTMVTNRLTNSWPDVFLPDRRTGERKSWDRLDTVRVRRRHARMPDPGDGHRNRRLRRLGREAEHLPGCTVWSYFHHVLFRSDRSAGTGPHTHPAGYRFTNGWQLSGRPSQRERLAGVRIRQH